MGTAERQLNLIKLLCCRRHETISKLALEFGVSKRTIQRDIDELTFLIPIYVKCGRYDGGVYVDEGYTMDRMYMCTEEIDLLIKIGNIAKSKLSEEEKNLFEKIIKTYTKPLSNRFLKP